MGYTLVLMVVVMVALVTAPHPTVAGDPDILTDFVVPNNVNGMNMTGDFFTYTGFRPIMMNMTPPAAPAGAQKFAVTMAAMPPAPVPGAQKFTVTMATMTEFPALNGQSLSYAMVTFTPESVVPPHTHPRSAELVLVLRGALSVGFVDTAGKLFTKDLAAGDMFVFPKGLVHYQSNPGKSPAVALSAFGSAAPGVVFVPATVFGAGIDVGVLAKAFNIDVPTVQKLKAALIPPPKN